MNTVLQFASFRLDAICLLTLSTQCIALLASSCAVDLPFKMKMHPSRDCRLKDERADSQTGIPILPPRERESRLGRGQSIWISARVGIVLQVSLSCPSSSSR